MVLVLWIDGGQITEAKFDTYPCPAANTCGRWIATAVEGMTVVEAAAFDESTILCGVGQMPLGREHCPKLAADALADALRRYADKVSGVQA
jgi:NifU-like protein involved in Fe-S cluster formation